MSATKPDLVKHIAPAWTKEHLKGQLQTNVNNRLEMISTHLQKNPKFKDLNLKLTDLTPEAQAVLMGREFDNLCANPRLSDEQKQHNFEIHGVDSKQELTQYSVKKNINEQHALDEKIDKKLAMENDKEDKKLAMRDYIIDHRLAEEELIIAEEIEYLLDQQATEPTPEIAAGQPLEPTLDQNKTLQSELLPGNKNNPESPSDQAIRDHHQIPTPEPKLRDNDEAESRIFEKFLKQKETNSEKSPASTENQTSIIPTQNPN